MEGMERRTISAPAFSRACPCATVAATSQVSVLVMLCTLMVASPPTATLPTMICRLLRRTIGLGLCISAARGGGGGHEFLAQSEARDQSTLIWRDIVRLAVELDSHP